MRLPPYRSLITTLITALLLVVFQLIYSSTVIAQDKVIPIKLGFLGSLSSFASEYGQASLDGVKLALKELQKAGENIELIIEDDASDTKKTVQAFNKLISVDKVKIIVSATWWAPSLVTIAERNNILLLSTETLEEKASPHGKTYFIFQGELKEWINVYEPTIVARGWKTAAIVRFVSTFGETLSNQLQTLFSRSGRTFLGDITYSSIDLSEAGSIALKVRKLNPDVLYIDAQPQSLPVIMKRLQEIGAGNTMAVIANNVLKVSLEEKLFTMDGFKELYYAQRQSYAPSFVSAFKEEYKKEPKLNADLGYYALRLAAAAAKSNDPLTFINSHPVVDGKTFIFDKNNVYNGAPQEVISVKKSTP